MGLVNLRSAKLLLLSVSPERLKELQAAAAKGGYKSPVSADSVPTAIASLKAGKLDIVVFDSDLKGTPAGDFIKAVRAAFPKVKLLPVGAEGSSVAFPLDATALGKAVDKLMMEKMGIAASGVTVSEDF